MAADSRASGGGGELSTEAEAVLKARTASAELVEVLIAIGKKPGRNAKSQVDAIRLVLEVAGVGVTQADDRHTELLRLLRSKLSKGAYGEVVRALADGAGVPGDGASAAVGRAQKPD